MQTHKAETPFRASAPGAAGALMMAGRKGKSWSNIDLEAKNIYLMKLYREERAQNLSTIFGKKLFWT